MIGKFAMATVAGALLCSVAAQAQTLSPALQALDAQLPGTLVNDPTRLDWAVQGTGFKTKPVVDATIPGAGAATQIEVKQAGAQPYSEQTFVPFTTAVAKGDTVTVGFYARALKAETSDGKGTIGIRFQRNADPWPGFGDTTIKLGPQWEWHEVSAVATIDMPPDLAVVAVQFGGAKQTIEIGETIVVKGANAIQGTAAPQPSAADVLSAAAQLPDPLKNIGRLIDRPELRNWGDSGPAGSYLKRDDGTIWLGKATRYSVATKGQNRWDVGTTIPIGEAIAEGDKLVIAFAAKTVSAGAADGKALVGVRVQSSDPPYDGFADHLVAVGPNWQLVRLNTTATKAIPAGKAAVALQFAEAPQVVDIGPVYVFKVE
jgi:hypothetical protein